MLSDSRGPAVLPPGAHQVWVVGAEQVLGFLVESTLQGESMCHVLRAGAELVRSQGTGREGRTQGKAQLDPILGGPAGTWE